MREERLADLLSRFGSLRVAVVGDLFLDEWFHIDPALDEPSLETGLPAWQVTSTAASPGAAGTVLNNLRAMGVGSLYAVSFTGEDGNGWRLRQLLAQRGVDTAHVLSVPERMTPAYMKPMFQRGERLEEGNRLDVKNRLPTPAWVEERIMASMETLAPLTDAIIALDQLTETDTGVVTARVRGKLAELGERYPSLILFADSRSRIAQFRNVIIKCNRQEAELALGEALPPERAIAAMRARTGRTVFVTLGSDGIATGEGPAAPAARQKGPIDVCGAGDAATAALVCGLCAGATPGEAAELGNLSSGVTVRKLGTTGTASQAEMTALYHEQFGERL